jgi:nitroreductase
VEFFEVIKKRRSVRSYTDDPVTEDELSSILRAVNAAPSAGNLQAFEVVVVRNAKRKAALAKAALGQNFISQAPLCLVFFAHPRRSAGEYGDRGRGLYCVQDATIAACHAHLACVALGLASVWVGAFSDDGVRSAVAASNDLDPVCILPIGRPAEAPAPTSRRALSDLVHQERLGVDRPGG